MSEGGRFSRADHLGAPPHDDAISGAPEGSLRARDDHDATVRRPVDDHIRAPVLVADDERAEDPARWNGLNLLGFALMNVRQTLLEHA
ncbi:hypothetical protein ACFQX6_65305 [Streptosporangium lutulentum]